MIEGWELVLTTVALIGAAISGGAFFAFSNFVMPALAGQPTANAVSAMQAINVKAPNPTFVASIVGAGLVGLPVAVANLDRLDEASAGLTLAGVTLSLASFAITIAFNVPRNNALARLDADAPSSEADWSRYLTSWTRANSVRTLTSLASVSCYALSLLGR